MRLYCATSNPGKLREFELAARRLGRGDWRFAPLSGIPPCQETGAAFEENAVQKAVYYSPHAAGLLFAEDSGLEVVALGGGPGVRSARWAGNDAQNNRRLVELLGRVKDRRARYVCVLALAEQGRLLRTFRGEVEGEIVDEPRGVNGFGYDPHFFYPPLGCTFAEATPEQKLEVSHRGRAVAAMLEYLQAAPAASAPPPSSRNPVPR
ncbi:MAG: RdgB/HAM1 family non-canonical purine NTP pyrophosphatase [Candidatus Solibacter usitatus]|nr:RdgB/HAM1 family non-canonical purine NTP pyrophosphatase [Candidatus Solibacter usitatus]